MVVHYCLGQNATDIAHQFSRQCPGKKDFVTVQTDQVKVQKQKKNVISEFERVVCSTHLLSTQDSQNSTQNKTYS